MPTITTRQKLPLPKSFNVDPDTNKPYTLRTRRAVANYGAKKCCKAHLWTCQEHTAEEIAFALNLTVYQYRAAEHAGAELARHWSLPQLKVMAGVEP